MYIDIYIYIYVLVIVRKSSCTRYNGTRGGVEIVIQYEAQPSTVWSIETPPLVPLYPVQLDFRTIIDLLYSWAIQRHQAGA